MPGVCGPTLDLGPDGRCWPGGVPGARSTRRSSVRPTTRPTTTAAIPATLTSFGWQSALGGAIGTAIGGPVGGAIGGALGSIFEDDGTPVPGNNNPVPGSGVGTIPGYSGGAVQPFAPASPCQPPLIRSSSGLCVAPNSPAIGPGGAGSVPAMTPLARPIGAAVLGVYGAGFSPGVRQTAVSVCPGGTVLGKDGVCYDKKQLRNTERMHPKERKPLLTGGDLNAISRASRAAGRLERQTKRLQKLGMIKKPARRRS